jgi:hypothetical protein
LVSVLSQSDGGHTAVVVQVAEAALDNNSYR